jgi:tetratricopeptide (TPR) repeat protein
MFAVHPVHVEAVAAVANRKDVLAGIFVLASAALWMSGRRSTWRYVASLFCAVLGILAKEVAALGVVPMLWLAELLRIGAADSAAGSRWPRAMLRLAPLALAALLLSIHLAPDAFEHFSRSWIQENVDPRLEGYHQVLASSLGSIPDALRLLVFPLRLSADYPIRAPQDGLARGALLGAAVIVLWIAAIAVSSSRSRLAAFALAWPLITYLPCSNVVPLTKFFVAERYLYVPSFGICVLFGLAGSATLGLAGTRHAVGYRRIAAATVTALIATLGARTVARNADWHDAAALWSSAIRAGFGTVRAYNNLGVALAERQRFDEAVDAYAEAVRLAPGYYRSHYNLGTALWHAGRSDEAEARFRTAAGSRFDDARRCRSNDGLHRRVARTDLGERATRLGVRGDAASRGTAARYRVCPHTFQTRQCAGGAERIGKCGTRILRGSAPGALRSGLPSQLRQRLGAAGTSHRGC